jgi:hypothetical protein
MADPRYFGVRAGRTRPDCGTGHPANVGDGHPTPRNSMHDRSLRGRNRRRGTVAFVVVFAVMLLAVELYGRLAYGSLSWMVAPPPKIDNVYTGGYTRYIRQSWIDHQDFVTAIGRWGGPLDLGHPWPLPYAVLGSGARCDGEPRLLFIPHHHGYDLYMREGCW